VSQAAILSTCNRTEIYTVADRDIRSTVRCWLLAQAGALAEMLRPHIHEITGREAAVHLCRVAAGLDSQLLGESEILSQVKEAMKLAKGAGTLGPVLERVFAAAIRAGKRVREETRISRGAFSIGRCAVETAKQKLGSLGGRTFLVIGAGKMAETAAKHLYSQGAETILVANRTYSKAQELAEQLGGRALRYDQIAQALIEADIIISSTAAPHFVLLPDQVAEAMSGRDGRELLLIDIAVPRDIDPAVGALPGVHLFDIDDLGGGLDQAIVCRAGEVEEAERIVDEATAELWKWLIAREVRPILQSLRGRFEQAELEQIARFDRKLARLSPEDRSSVAALASALTRRLLHEATVSLKEELAAGNGKVHEALLDPGTRSAAASSGLPGIAGRLRWAGPTMAASEAIGEVKR
jgi:glutamyl-tRNA reductase